MLPTVLKIVTVYLKKQGRLPKKLRIPNKKPVDSAKLSQARSAALEGVGS
jgi:hypothetical protein